MKTVALVSLGCAKNVVDLQVAVGNLLKEGYVLSSDPDRADVAIINTCAFIASAREESEYEIARALALKRRGNFSKVVVTGCYPERYPKAAAKFPGVDSWKGVPRGWTESKTPAFRLSGKAFAYLKIAEGCVHRCSYCAIPLIRGAYRSRPEKDVLAEAKALLATGCRELDIVAQDPMLYKPSLAGLLWKLDDLEGDFWVRVLYSYPSEIDDGFVDWLKNSKHAAKYVDVPLQHTDPAVLKRMNRAGAIEASLSVAQRLRREVPGITLRTTIMTGFPGETPARFERMLETLAQMEFDHLGAFAFSPERGTPAAKMSGRPSRKTAEERERKVMELAAAIWRKKARAAVGSVRRALVVAPGTARLESQAPDVDGVVFVDAGTVGEFIDVRLAKAEGFDFFGEPA